MISAINTPEYGLPKWLETQIKFHLHDKFSIPSLTEFINKISKLDIKHTNVFAILDIKSLETKFPLNKVIEDIMK